MKLHLYIEKIIYQVKPDSEWKEGLYIGEHEISSEYSILDSNYEVVNYVYTFKPSSVKPFKLEVPFSIFNSDNLQKLETF